MEKAILQSKKHFMSISESELYKILKEELTKLKEELQEVKVEHLKTHIVLLKNDDFIKFNELRKRKQSLEKSINDTISRRTQLATKNIPSY